MKLGGAKIVFKSSSNEREVLYFHCKQKKCGLSIKWGKIGLSSASPKWYMYAFKPHEDHCHPSEDKKVKCTGDEEDNCPYSVNYLAGLIEDILLHNPYLQIHTLAAHLKAIFKAKGDTTIFQGGHDRFPVSIFAVPSPLSKFNTNLFL